MQMKTSQLAMPVSMMIAAYVVRLTVVGLIWSWLHKMRSVSCECSGTWKREFLYWSLAGDVVLRLLVYAVYDQIPSFVKSIIALYDLFQLGMLWSYARDLQKAACECSDSWKRELAQSWPVFRLGVLVGLLQVAVLFAFLMVSVKNDSRRGRA